MVLDDLLIAIKIHVTPRIKNMGYNETRDPHKRSCFTMNPVKNALVRTHKFVSDHKVAIAVATTATVCTVVHLRVVRNMNGRLREIGVFDEFWNTTSEL